MKPSNKILLLLLVVGLALFWSLFFGIQRAVLHSLLSTMTPAEIAEFNDWRTKKLTFPEEEIAAEFFAESELAAARRYYEEWMEYEKKNLRLNAQFRQYRQLDSASDEAIALWEEISAKLDATEPMLAALTEMAAQETYTMSVLADVTGFTGLSGMPGAYALSLQEGAKLLQLKNHSLLREGETAEALAAAETIILAARIEKYSSLIFLLISTLKYSIGADAWLEAVEHCDDPELLRQTLKRQNELASPAGLITREVRMSTLDALGVIRTAQRQGYAAEIQGRTGFELGGERVKAEQFLNQLSGNTMPIPPLVGIFSQESSSLFGQPLSYFSYRLLYPINQANVAEFYSRADVAWAKFELLRLYTAQKLYRLEQGRAPEQLSELVPAYLPEIAPDPFSPTDQPFMFNNATAKSFFYSIGPDGVDQQGAILYDPTNGTTSAGDTFFKAPSEKKE